MLHHCNMDRLWAYWQAIRPAEANMKGSYSGNSRWATQDGTTISINSPLQPFFNQNSQLHTSNTVSSIRNFGYTYKELEFWRKSDNQIKKDATRLINMLYSNSSSGSSQSKKRSLPKKRYFVRIHLRAEELPRPASVNVYIGGQNVGSMVIMREPNKGDLNAVLSLDKLFDAAKEASENFIDGLMSGKPDFSKVFEVDIVTVCAPRVELGITYDTEMLQGRHF